MHASKELCKANKTFTNFWSSVSIIVSSCGLNRSNITGKHREKWKWAAMFEIKRLPFTKGQQNHASECKSV